MEANKALLKEWGKSLLNLSLNSFRHSGNLFSLTQKMSNDPVKISTFGTKNLHLRELLYQGFKTFEFHEAKDSI